MTDTDGRPGDEHIPMPVQVGQFCRNVRVFLDAATSEVERVPVHVG